MNLLQETIEALEDQGKKPSDILWVGLKNGLAIGKNLNDLLFGFDEVKEISWSWEDFSKIADFEYNAGFGLQEINEALVIVGKDWWLERHEYDGKEWWEFKTLPERPNAGEVLTLDMIYEKPKIWSYDEVK